MTHARAQTPTYGDMNIRGRQMRCGLAPSRALVWEHVTPALSHFLAQTGFRLDYRADGVPVYRPAA
jgi:hypothetical protein